VLEEPTVLVEIDAGAGIATITLNRPAALNALTVPMKQELLAALGNVLCAEADNAVHRERLHREARQDRAPGECGGERRTVE